MCRPSQPAAAFSYYIIYFFFIGVKRPPTACQRHLHTKRTYINVWNISNDHKPHNHNSALKTQACSRRKKKQLCKYCIRYGDHTRLMILSKCGYADETIEWDNKNEQKKSILYLMKSSFTCVGLLSVVLPSIAAMSIDFSLPAFQ